MGHSVASFSYTQSHMAIVGGPITSISYIYIVPHSIGEMFLVPACFYKIYNKGWYIMPSWAPESGYCFWIMPKWQMNFLQLSILWNRHVQCPICSFAYNIILIRKSLSLFIICAKNCKNYFRMCTHMSKSSVNLYKAINAYIFTIINAINRGYVYNQNSPCTRLSVFKDP